MKAVEIVKARLDRITSNKGHVRLLVVVYVIWIAATIWIFWSPVPAAPRIPDFMGFPRVVSCQEKVLDYENCAASADAIAASVTVFKRFVIVFLTPIILSSLLALGLFVFEWVKEGYREKAE